MGGVATDSLPAPIPAATPRCGPGPYQLTTFNLRNALPASPSERLIQGGSVTFKACPELLATTGPSGKVQVALTAEAETWVRFEALGFLPTLLGEVTVSGALSGGDGIAVTLVPKGAQPVILPMFQPTEPLLFVQLQAGATGLTDECRERENVTISVKDQPDARVHYRKGPNASPTYSVAGATGPDGVAIVMGVNHGTSVQIQARKAGCTYKASYGDAVQGKSTPIIRSPTEAGAVTFVVINPVP